MKCKLCKHKHDDVNSKGYCLHCEEELYWLMKNAEAEFNLTKKG